MKPMDYFKIIVDDIHTTTMATIDCHGEPITCAIDMMDYDEHGLYFLTAKGKSFYTRLKDHPTIALTALKGDATLTSYAISIQGHVKELGNDRLDDLFAKNSYMASIYPDMASRQALTVFMIDSGTGECFDLSTSPMQRHTFAFGGQTNVFHGYHVTDRCIGCKLCYSKCPTKCIDISSIPVVIDQTHCLHCGNCYTICPARAIEKG